MRSLFEEMGGTYTLGADGIYGKYGRMHLRYLKEHHKVRQDLSRGLFAKKNQ